MNYRRNENVILRSIAGETLLVPVCGNLVDLQNIYVLEGIGEFLWNLVDDRSLDLLRDAVTARFEIDAEQAGRDVREFIDD